MRDSAGIGEAAGDVYTVTEIAEAVRQHLESEFSRISVLGEVANCKAHVSGHVYFTLRDATSMLHAALFRRAAERLAWLPEDGALVVASGRISHFAGGGRTQLVVSDLVQAGRGGKEREFRELLAALEREGLTAESRKRPLPPYPFRIAVVTSPSGAVIEDILDTLARRWPAAEVVHIACEVQGPRAADSVARAIRAADAIDDIDVVILARGGGSVEDLWTFNLEPVARSVAASRHPIVTGIGHETDTTVCDYVSDRRAATPTAAAELVAPLAAEVARLVAERVARVATLTGSALELRGRDVDWLLRSAALAAIEHRVERASFEADDLAGRLRGALDAAARELGASIESARDDLLRALERRAALAREERSAVLAGLAAFDPRHRVRLERQSLAAALARARAAARGTQAERRARLAGAQRQLEGLGPRNVLKRGYAVCTTVDERRVIPRAAGLRASEEMRVRFFDGDARCRVEETRKGAPWPGRRPSKTR